MSERRWIDLQCGFATDHNSEEPLSRWERVGTWLQGILYAHWQPELKSNQHNFRVRSLSRNWKVWDNHCVGAWPWLASCLSNWRWQLDLSSTKLCQSHRNLPYSIKGMFQNWPYTLQLGLASDSHGISLVWHAQSRWHSGEETSVSNWRRA